MGDLEDREHIRSLIWSYNHRFDAGDAAGVVALFTAEGGLGSPEGGRLLGGRGLESYVQKQTGLRHVSSNELVTIDGDTAHATSTLVLYERATRSVLRIGVYEDDLVRTDGQWLFARRVWADVD